MKINLKAIILAAGEGKRLRPLTNNCPKCLVQLFGKSLHQWQIETFQKCGIFDISTVVGYMGNEVKTQNITYYTNPRFSETNMVETLFCAQEKLNDNAIVSYGDIIFEKKVLEKLIESKDDISVVVDLKWEKYWRKRFTDPLHDAESLTLDNRNHIQNIGQKVDSIKEIQGQYIGLMKFQGDGIKIINDFYTKSKNASFEGNNPLNPKLPFEKSFMTDFLQGIVDEGHKIKAIPIFNGWLELDSIDDYYLYNIMHKDGIISEFFNIND